MDGAPNVADKLKWAGTFACLHTFILEKQAKGRPSCAELTQHSLIDAHTQEPHAVPSESAGICRQRRVCNLLVGTDEVGKSYGVWLAVVVGHCVEYGACSGVLAGVRTRCNDDIQDAHLTTYSNVRDLRSVNGGLL